MKLIRHMSRNIDLPTRTGVLKVVATSGQNEPLLWVPGFLGTMNGAKIEYLQNINEQLFNRPLWKFDYSNIGMSTGDFTFENWVKDAETVLHQAFKYEQRQVILVASSMGAFISVHIAQRNPELVKAMYLCAPAKDLFKDRFHEISSIPGDIVPIPGSYEHSSNKEGIPKQFFESIPQFWFDQIQPECPVHILHPELDEIWYVH